MELSGGKAKINLVDLSNADRRVGHSGEVFTARFDPAGHLIASGSMDRSISTFS